MNIELEDIEFGTWLCISGICILALLLILVLWILLSICFFVFCDMGFHSCFIVYFDVILQNPWRLSLVFTDTIAKVEFGLPCIMCWRELDALDLGNKFNFVLLDYLFAMRLFY